MENNTSLTRARSYVLWLLARRDYPRRQLEEKLRKRELSPEQIKTLLDTLAENGLYKEETFKKLRTRQLLKRGFGPSMVKAKMSRDRIIPTQDELNSAYEELDLSPEAQIKQLIEKYAKRYEYLALDKHSLKQRIIQALLRKGFSISLVMREMTTFTSENSHSATR